MFQNLDTSIHGINTTNETRETKEETSELTTQAALNEHKHRVWYLVVQLSGDKHFCLNHSTMWLSHRNSMAHTKFVALSLSPDWTQCEKKLQAQWGQTELRAKPESMGTPCETHLSLGYASIGLSRQAGGGEKQEGDALKPSATGTTKQTT